MSGSKPDIKDIFGEALELDASERERFLDRACAGHSALRERVEALLESHRDAGAFLQAPGDHVPPTGNFGEPEESRKFGEDVGASVGPYRLLEQIGEGGFGVVYLAEQTEPVKRRVALKIIKPGMDTRQVIARFEAERQALALMDHPGIARVFDGGATKSGRPYFVMELVKGVPITEYCDTCRLTTRERLKLFLEVCQAVRHAHQKGIIHRDIKPSNVLIAIQDRRPVPKIIDFGVAKAINQRLTEQTLHTAYAQMVGTPAYMSPEQAELSALDVDTRTDIYSLGVLLYELLTSTTPLEKRRFEEMSFDELRRAIREEDPPSPSARLSTLGEDATTVAEHRRTDLPRLQQAVRGDLDWIAMKCLEKDPGRRYDTAGDLVGELRRYLEDEPVSARPPSATYRFRKFARRNRGSLTAAALIVVALLAGTAVSVRQAVRARQAEELARERLQSERAARRDATRTVNDYFTLVSQNTLLRQPELRPLRRDLLERALHYYEEFLNRYGDDPELQAEAAATNLRIAILTYELGTGENWLPWFERGVALVEELLRRDVDVSELESLGADRDWASAARSIRLRQREDAVRILEHAAEVWRELVMQYPDEPEFQNDLAAFYNGLAFFQGSDELQESEQLYLQAVHLWRELIERHPDELRYRAGLIQSLSCRGADLVRLNRLPEAEANMREALDIARNLADESDAPAVRELLSMMYRENAYLLEDCGRFGEAEQAWRQAVALQEELRQKYPNAPRYEWGAFCEHLALGEVLWALGREEDARLQFHHADELADELDPENAQARNLLALNLANCPEPSFRDPARAIQVSQQVVEQSGEIGDYWLTLGMAHYRQGNYRQAVDALQEVNRLDTYLDSCESWFFLAMAHWRLDETERAHECYEQGVEQMLDREFRCAEARRAREEAAELMGIQLTSAVKRTAAPATSDVSHK